MPPSTKSFQTVQYYGSASGKRPNGIPDRFVNEVSNSRADVESAFQIPDFGQPTKLEEPLANTRNGLAPQPFGANVSAAEIAPPSVQPNTPLPALDQSFRVLQQWEGVVLTEGGTAFEALIRDLTEPDRPEERATIRVEEIFEDDQPLIKPGATFFWTIGYETRRSGRKVSSVIRFRRVPRWSTFELSRAQKSAKEFEYILDDHGGPTKNGTKTD
jgi:hypothetical protein